MMRISFTGMIKKDKNKQLVYAAGVFDLLHIGHVRYLQKAKSMGDELIVGLLTDEGTARYKPYKPIIPYEQRYEVLMSLRCVDYIVRQYDTDPTSTFMELALAHKMIPDILVRGDDCVGVPPGSEWIEAAGGVVVKISYTQEVSDSKIKQEIVKKWNMADMK